MKRIYLLTFMSMAAATASYAQYTPQDTTVAEPATRITWGIHAGINVSNLKINSSSTSYNAGFNGGIDLELPVSASFVVQPELNLSQMGGFINYNSQGIETTYKDSYISIPVLFKYKIPQSRFGIYIGPQYGLLLSSSASQSGVNANRSKFTANDFAGVLGAEYYLKCNLGISARYQLGLANVAKGDTNPEGTTFKNNGFTVTVGFRF